MSSFALAADRLEKAFPGTSAISELLASLRMASHNHSVAERSLVVPPIWIIAENLQNREALLEARDHLDMTLKRNPDAMRRLFSEHQRKQLAQLVTHIDYLLESSPAKIHGLESSEWEEASKLIDRAMLWMETSEGHAYWANVRDACLTMAKGSTHVSPMIVPKRDPDIRGVTSWSALEDALKLLGRATKLSGAYNRLHDKKLLRDRRGAKSTPAKQVEQAPARHDEKPRKVTSTRKLLL